jgi:hypothetical protein
MKIQRLLIVLTFVNLGLLAYLLLPMPRPLAAAQPTAAVLRGRELQIIDDHERVRASIKVQPAGRAPDGKLFPENVIIRLIDTKGRPEMKLGASEQGAGIAVIGETDETYIVLNAEAESSVKLLSKGGRHQIIKP